MVPGQGLEYLPADAPTHYRVRVPHTTNGEIGLPVDLRDKSRAVDAEMAGYSRTQVVSGHDGGLLFTLYRGVAGEGDRHGYAFVHTLGFAGGVWCVRAGPGDLEMLGPAPQQRSGTVTATSIDVTPDSIDSGDGIVAVLVDGASGPP